MCFVFYSHLKNLKEVYVTTALDRRAQAVRGQVGQRGRAPRAAWAAARALKPASSHPQVSFYRGEVPEEVPEEAEAARQKRGADAPWMATLPLKLPVRPGGGSVCGGGRGWPGVWAGAGGGARAHCHCVLPTETAGIQGPRAGGWPLPGTSEPGRRRDWVPDTEQPAKCGRAPGP